MFIRTWEVYRGPQFPRENYDISKILELIANKFHMVLSNKIINLKTNPFKYLVEINSSLNFANSCYAEHSISKLLGFEIQSTVIETSQTRAVEYMVFNSNKVFKQNWLPHFTEYQICMCTQILLNYLR